MLYRQPQQIATWFPICSVPFCGREASLSCVASPSSVVWRIDTPPLTHVAADVRAIRARTGSSSDEKNVEVECRIVVYSKLDNCYAFGQPPSCLSVVLVECQAPFGQLQYCLVARMTGKLCLVLLFADCQGATMWNARHAGRVSTTLARSSALILNCGSRFLGQLAWWIRELHSLLLEPCAHKLLEGRIGRALGAWVVLQRQHACSTIRRVDCVLLCGTQVWSSALLRAQHNLVRS